MFSRYQDDGELVTLIFYPVGFVDGYNQEILPTNLSEQVPSALFKT